MVVALAVVLDLVLSGGRVVDGTGAPWFRADVGIRGDRITAVGDLSRARARRRIELRDRMVAPGFIDMLGQSERFLLADDRVESKIRQGITTEITGEGESIAPTAPRLLVEVKPFDDRYGIRVDWSDLNGYFQRFRATLNLGTFFGAATARALVLGYGDVEANPAQIQMMQRLVGEAIEQGALGLSTALIYPPGSFARTPELIELAKVAARHGGIYATHVRGEAGTLFAALDEAITIGREAHIPVEVWHLKVAGRDSWGRMKEVVARIEAARASGVDISANMYPYDAARNGLDANVPEWAHEGGTAAMIARFRDPAARARIQQELWHGGLGAETPDGIQVAAVVNPALEKYVGQRLDEIARSMGKSPEDALLDLVEADRGQTEVVRFVMSEDDVQLGLRQPWVSLGTDDPGQSTDGPFAKRRGHPRGFGSAPRLLGHYARDLKLFSVEEAVRKMTSLPARRVRLFDRGVLRPGMAADLVVFDPATVIDRATYADPSRYPEGIDVVIVNGKVVLDEGKLTAERPGRALRR
ncbi:MAG: D-aminoacylase [Deltaproteobacteria bacterium]|nr:MAG: D-aminoacylase [Deltaproteobacteria bacterium]